MFKLFGHQLKLAVPISAAVKEPLVNGHLLVS